MRRVISVLLAMGIISVLCGSPQILQALGAEGEPVRPCLIVNPQIVVFTLESRYHRLFLFNSCASSLHWAAATPFPFIRIDTSQAVNPIPPYKVTPVGVYVDWNLAPSQAIEIREPAPILEWLERAIGTSVPREAKLFYGIAFISFWERKDLLTYASRYRYSCCGPKGKGNVFCRSAGPKAEIGPFNVDYRFFYLARDLPCFQIRRDNSRTVFRDSRISRAVQTPSGEPGGTSLCHRREKARQGFI